VRPRALAVLRLMNPSQGSRFPPEALGVVIPPSVGELDGPGQHTPRSASVSVRSETRLPKQACCPQTQFLGDSWVKQRVCGSCVRLDVSNVVQDFHRRKDRLVNT